MTFEKKFISIFPNIFPYEVPVDVHHVDGKWFVVPLPRYIHRGRGMEKKGKGAKRFQQHLKSMNDWIEFYYGLNPEEFLNG